MMNFDKDSLVRFAMRDNNKLRPYLLVNPLQGKHMPVAPETALNMFNMLAKLLCDRYREEKLFLIGFAETATAIGASVSVSCENVLYYIHTTRENVNGAHGYLNFSEVHSHASEQKLVLNNLEYFIKNTDRIIFVEDEVTTGNTILNLISALQSRYGSLKKLNFGILSILNSMSDKAISDFEKNGISCMFIERIDNSKIINGLMRYKFDERLKKEVSFAKPNLQRLYISGMEDPRMGVYVQRYLKSCEKLSKELVNFIDNKNQIWKKILVLGTEEFMFPPLLFAYELANKLGADIKFHASTRSPILPSSSDGYPIKTRHGLKSVYENERKTFIYNLESYDAVIWIYDCIGNDEGIESMCGALEGCGCKNIYAVRWGE